MGEDWGSNTFDISNFYFTPLKKSQETKNLPTKATIEEIDNPLEEYTIKRPAKEVQFLGLHPEKK